MRLLIIFLFLIYSCTIFAQTSWEEKKSEDGIQVFLRDVEGMEIKEFQGRMLVNCPTDAVMRLLTDFTKFKEWGYRMQTVNILKKVNPVESFVYYEMSMPWPLDNRDLIYHVRSTQNKATRSGLLIMECLPDYQAPYEGKVRIQNAKTTYKVKALNNGKTEIIYQQYADPVGVPAWMVNVFLVDSPFKTLQNLRIELDCS